MKMLYFLLCCVFALCGCSFYIDANSKDRDACFKNGGAEYQSGQSAGNRHTVCIYKNKVSEHDK